MSKSSTLLSFTVILGLCFRCFLRGAVIELREYCSTSGSRAKTQTSRFAEIFNGNCYHFRVDELCKYEQDSNVKGKS